MPTIAVVNRDKPTVIAYLLLRMTINSDNELIPKLNNRLDQASNGVKSIFSLFNIASTLSIVLKTRVDMIDAPDTKGADSKLTVPKINPADSVVGEWVMVDMVREVGFSTYICHLMMLLSNQNIIIMYLHHTVEACRLCGSGQ